MEREIDIEIDQAIQIAAHKAAPLFRLFGWIYRNDTNPPSINELSNDLNQMIYQLRANPEAIAQHAGRFIVSKEKSEDGKADYSISLHLADIYGI